MPQTGDDSIFAPHHLFSTPVFKRGGICMRGLGRVYRNTGEGGEGENTFNARLNFAVD